jgi:protein TonB
MARRRDRDEGGHPVFWLLLGFLCGVVAMLGALLLLLSGEVTGEGDSAPPPAPPQASAPVEIPPLKGAPPPGGPVVLVPPPSVEPLPPIQEPVVRPTLPTFRPESQAAPARPAPARPAPPATKPAAAPRPPARPVPPARRSNTDQMAEDAAASGMTARTR